MHLKVNEFRADVSRHRNQSKNVTTWLKIAWKRKGLWDVLCFSTHSCFYIELPKFDGHINNVTFLGDLATHLYNKKCFAIRLAKMTEYQIWWVIKTSFFHRVCNLQKAFWQIHECDTLLRSFQRLFLRTSKSSKMLGNLKYLVDLKISPGYCKEIIANMFSRIQFAFLA